jgi:hypothetical protein
MQKPRPQPPLPLPDDLGIQSWLDSCAQGYLAATAHGRPRGSRLPDAYAESRVLRVESIRYTVQLVVAERCALAASAGLLIEVPWESCKRYLATQVLDEGRHVEVFTRRLFDLGVEPAALETVIHEHAHPDLLGLSERILEEIRDGDLLVGLVAHGVILDEILATTYEMLTISVAVIDPDFAHAIEGILRDERRHTDFAERLLAELLGRHPEKKVEIERLQRELTSRIIRIFEEAFRENPMLAEVHRLVTAGDVRSPARWNGIDLVSADAHEMERTLIRAIVTRLRVRFSKLGLRWQAPALH